MEAGEFGAGASGRVGAGGTGERPRTDEWLGITLQVAKFIQRDEIDRTTSRGNTAVMTAATHAYPWRTNSSQRVGQAPTRPVRLTYVTYVRTYVSTQVRTNVRAFIGTYLRTYVRTCIHAHVRPYVLTYVSASTYVRD